MVPAKKFCGGTPQSPRTDREAIRETTIAGQKIPRGMNDYRAMSARNKS